MVWFRENWYEELLRQLNEGLVMCQAVAFASRADGKPHNITCYSLDHLHIIYINILFCHALLVVMMMRCVTVCVSV